jgi:RecB family endonuclease NucS
MHDRGHLEDGEPVISLADGRSARAGDPAVHELVAAITPPGWSLQQEHRIPYFNAGAVHIVTTSTLAALTDAFGEPVAAQRLRTAHQQRHRRAKVRNLRGPKMIPSCPGASFTAMRLIVARCSVDYSGRLVTHLAEATRLLMFKADGTFMVWSDHGSQSVKPLNWMTPPTVVEEDGSRIIVRKHGGSGEDRVEVELHEVLSDVTHEMGSPEADVALAKDGVEAHLQELLAESPEWCGEGFRLVRREWPTDIGPVDLMCRDAADGWVAVEVKRVAGIEAVEQLTRYLERIRRDPEFDQCRGVLVGQVIRPQARVLAEARGLACVEVDLAVLRGEREPELRLFAA